MLPLYLSIQGLYSYQAKQEIDFSKLTEAGLFGIFGNVGSGKSSVLEAISYALYGETERLNKAEKRAYNMLNLKSNHAIIDFQFLNFENRKFRFVAQWKRRKKFEDTTTLERTAYEWINESWIPLESADGTAVSNLSYANFRRTIIIPQGQFKEFLELKGKDRSEMMKEIFFLNKFDLGPKVSLLQSENNRLLENLKGALSGFENISEDYKKLKIEALNIAKEELQRTRNEHVIWLDRLKNLELSHSNRMEYKQLCLEWDTITEQSLSIKQQELEVEEYETAALNFKEPLNKEQQLLVESKIIAHKIESLQKQHEQLTSTIATYKHQLSDIEADYTQLDSFKRQLIEFDILLQISESFQNKLELEARLQKGIPLLDLKKKEESALKISLSDLEQELEVIKKNKINTQELLELGKWYQEKEEIKRKYQALTKQKENILQEINNLEYKFLDKSYTVDNWQEKIQEELYQIQTDLQNLQTQETALLLKEELSKFVHNLQDGSPCPLCGSLAHPSVMHTTDVTQEKQNLKRAKDIFKTKELDLRTLQSEFNTASQYLKDRKKEKSTTEDELVLLDAENQQHLLNFIWKDFDCDDRSKFDQKRAFVAQLEQTIHTKEEEIKSLRNNLNSTSENVQKYQRSIDDIQNKIEILNSNIVQNRNLIIQLKDLLSTPLNQQQIKLQTEELKNKIITIESNYKTWNQALQDSNSQLANVNGQLNELNTNSANINKQLLEVNNLLQQLCSEFGFLSIDRVKVILDKKIDLIQLKKTIHDFYLQKNTLQFRLEELKGLIHLDSFTEEAFAEARDQVNSLTTALEQHLSLVGGLEKELERINSELSKKSALLDEFNKLNARKENLKLLDNMFKGSGFVNYVSSIHLHRLCEIANERFQRLTKNQLSLCINENNEFEVKDFLNNGYQRSIKTLSGGQSFQASLCLALALAENIQSLNKSDRNFFFIDEGFGTQDNESITTVFDTLQYLNQENRVVGIISHVEELKEKMPRSITVTKDMERGSQIHFN